MSNTLKIYMLTLLLVLSLLGGIIYQSFEDAASLEQPPPSNKALDKKNVIDWASLLVHDLEAEIQTAQNVYIHPLTLSVLGENKEHVDVFDSALRDALTKSHLLKPLEPTRLSSINDMNNLRQGAKREMSQEGMSLIADLLNANGELKGEVRLNEGAINVKITLTNEHNKAIAHTIVAFPKSIPPKEILAQTKATRSLKPLIDKGELNVDDKGKLNVEISTSHGVHNVTYYEGESLRLFIRTNQAAYVYVYVFDANQFVTLLYPESRYVNTNKVKEGELFILPEDGLPYKLSVQPPFGPTTLWVVASTNSLKFPTEMSDTWLQADTLRENVRDLGKTSKGYAEAEIVANTIGLDKK